MIRQLPTQLPTQLRTGRGNTRGTLATKKLSQRTRGRASEITDNVNFSIIPSDIVLNWLPRSPQPRGARVTKRTFVETNTYLASRGSSDDKQMDLT